MIGVLGASGAVGGHAIAALESWGERDLRLGSRRLNTVDIFEPASLQAFCDGCDVILNCAGPAHEIGDRVAVAAIDAGAAYVDAAGDDVLHDQVARSRPHTAVISAGMMPGLTGLLPRYLAQMTAGAPRRLTGYIGGRDRFTLTAAVDYLASGSAFGSARTVLRGGRRAPGSPAPGAAPPFFPEPADAMAFLSTETERVCRRLGIGDAGVYSVFAGEHLIAAMRGSADAAALAHAATLDTFGRQAYQLVVFELVTTRETRTLVLRGRGASELTGVFAGLAALAVARHTIPRGVHHAGEILDPAEAVARLREHEGVQDLTVLEGPAERAGAYVEETV